MNTTPEKYTTFQARLAQWVRDATPEQKQKVTELFQEVAGMAESFQQVAGMAESFRKAVDSISRRLTKTLSFSVVMSPSAASSLKAYIQYLQAGAALMDSLDAMKKNPDIMASPVVAAFVARLCDEVGQSYAPFEVLASHQKEREKPRIRAKAVRAVSKRKDRQALPELEAFAVQLYRQGPFGGGEWKNLPTAARAIESKVNRKASDLGWERKKTKYSYQVIQEWIEKGLAPT